VVQSAAANGDRKAAEIRTIRTKDDPKPNRRSTAPVGKLATYKVAHAVTGTFRKGLRGSAISFAITPPPGWIEERGNQVKGETVVKFIALVAHWP